MHTSLKLLLTGAMVAVAVWVAWQYRRPANGGDAAANATEQPGLERRLTTGTVGQGVAAANPATAQPFRVPTASTSFWPENSADPPKLPRDYQQAFSPVGALLQPIDAPDVPHVARHEPASGPASYDQQIDNSFAEPITHEIKDGDTLQSLAAHYLGDANYAAALFAANRDVLTSPDLLPLGAELKIPPHSALLAADNQPTTGEPTTIEPPIVPIPRGALSSGR